MAYIDLPAPFWGPPVATSSALPTSAPTGQVRVALDTEQAYLWDGAAWQEVFGGGGGSGDVVGPASATDNAVARFDGTTGKLLQNSVVIIGDTGNVTGVVNFTATGTTTLAVALTGPLKAASGVVSASAINLASAEVTGVLPVANGGSGTSTAFTTGSVIFAGASGTYSQDNANFFWDDTNNRLGILTTSPAVALHVAGTVQTSGSIILGNSAGTLSVSSTNLSLGTSTTTTTTIAGGVALFSGLTITANTNPTFNLAQTWNGAGVTFTGIKLNITDTASASTSLLMDLQVGAVSQFSVRKDGACTSILRFLGPNGSLSTPTYSFSSNTNTGIYSAGTNRVAVTCGGGKQVDINVNGMALGNYGADYSFLMESAAGAADRTGFNLILGAQRGTGSGTPGSIIFQTSTALGSGSTVQTLTERMRINGSNGFVGIGTTSPGVALDVVGTIRRLAGTSTSYATVGGTLFNSATQQGNTTTSETDLFTNSIAANTLATNLDTIEFYSAGTFAATANNKRIRVYFGSTAILDTGALAVTTASNWRVTGSIIRTGAATQKAIVTLMSSDTTITGQVSYTTPAETLSGAVTLRITGTATATNDIVGELWNGSWQPAAT